MRRIHQSIASLALAACTTLIMAGAKAKDPLTAENPNPQPAADREAAEMSAGRLTSRGGRNRWEFNIGSLRAVLLKDGSSPPELQDALAADRLRFWVPMSLRRQLIIAPPSHTCCALLRNVCCHVSALPSLA